MSFSWESIEGWAFFLHYYALIRSEIEYTLLFRCVEVIISARKPVEKSCTPKTMAKSAK